MNYGFIIEVNLSKCQPARFTEFNDITELKRKMENWRLRISLEANSANSAKHLFSRSNYVNPTKMP